MTASTRVVHSPGAPNICIHAKDGHVVVTFNAFKLHNTLSHRDDITDALDEQLHVLLQRYLIKRAQKEMVALNDVGPQRRAEQ